MREKKGGVENESLKERGVRREGEVGRARRWGGHGRRGKARRVGGGAGRGDGGRGELAGCNGERQRYFSSCEGSAA